MSKAFAAPTVHFKGSGWAKKDRKSVSGPVKPKVVPEAGISEASTGSPPADGKADAPKEG